MKISPLRIILTLAISLAVFIANGQVKYSNDFLSIGVGARGLAMGGAQVATVEDATSGYWNPAGILGVQSDIEVAAMHAEYFAGIAQYDFGSIVAKLDDTRAIAFTIIRFGVDNIPNTLELVDPSGNIDYENVASFSEADYAFMFSYAKTAKVKGLRYGGSAKVIDRIVGDFAHAWGFGLDFGVQYQKDKWYFGAFGQDITSTFNAWTFNTSLLAPVFSITNNEIPANSVEVTLPKLILGAGYKTNLTKKISWLTELDIINTFDGQRNVLISSNPWSIDPHLGMEFGYDNFIFLRGGITNIQTEENLDGSMSTVFQPNFGVGIKIKNLTIDYALTNIGDELYSNVFSLKLDLYKHKK
jgi:hypothetical protein